MRKKNFNSRVKRRTGKVKKITHEEVAKAIAEYLKRGEKIKILHPEDRNSEDLLLSLPDKQEADKFLLEE